MDACRSRTCVTLSARPSHSCLLRRVSGRRRQEAWTETWSVFFVMFHNAHKAIKQKAQVLGARAGFRVSLEAERRRLRVFQALYGAIEQGSVCHTQMGKAAPCR